MSVLVLTLGLYMLGLLLAAVGSRLAGRCTTWCCALLGLPMWVVGGTIAPFCLALPQLMLALLAIVFNNIVGRRYPHPLAAEEVKAKAVPLGLSVTRDDIHAALLDGQFLDIDEDDVQELLENIEHKARQRIASARRS